VEYARMLKIDLSTPMTQKKIGPVDAGVREIIDGKKIQDGCCSGQVG
jgi:hypothetical protein